MTAAAVDWRDFATFGDQRITPTEPDPDHPIVFNPQVGDFVKLMWPLGEAMWVAVDAIGEHGQLTGTLANTPATVPLQYGDRIRFSTSDVLRQMSAPAAGAA
ncbi:hypothetical protein OEM_13580 [Mycobacterium intracellulare subsp. yongonense 05-1390]|uniref:hypothetical protein n=1 Tax=Mycobacterium intracellulare TaxID=1767 RepID=UPI00035563BC|nr:hypothetical protein [Mycobacterium intracellulare]AGP62893.1 hypothetical protein OEM_13580 [Mycobacterium intracellulare subsp. yongonense 05-1390]